MIDPAFDMPVRNWAPQGSFIIPVSPPVDGPLDGDLVQLPCINRDWLLILMGALDQLRNPSTWNAGSDSGTDLVLSRVTQLQEAVWSAMSTPCCNVEMRLTSSCELQFSTDGGATWTTATDWDANFGDCVKANVPPAVPTPVNPGHPSDNACGVASYLAQQLMEIATQKLAAALSAGQSVDRFINEIVTTLVAVFPVLDFIVAPFQGMYTTALPQPLSELSAAASDTGFFHSVQCAIYSAIASVGYVDSTNFSLVATNIASISYVHAWVPTMVANLWNSLGLTNIQAIQAAGSLTAGECGDCGGSSWCWEIDFTVSDHGFTQTAPGIAGTYVPGEGWVATAFSGRDYINIISPSFAALSPRFDNVAVLVRTGAWSGGSGGHPRSWLVYSPPGTLQGAQDYSHLGAFPIFTKVGEVASGPPAEEQFSVQWSADLGTGIVIRKIQLFGSGTNPFGANNCTE